MPPTSSSLYWTTAEAAELFCGLAGDRVIPADQHIVDKIVDLCGWPPWQFASPPHGCASSRPASPPNSAPNSSVHWTKAGRWTGCPMGAAPSVRHWRVLPTTYRPLNGPAPALAGLHPGRDLEPWALAALADTPVRDAQRSLDQLYMASLVHQPSHRRYTLHELVAAYARELAKNLATAEREAALNRLFDHYATVSHQATNLTSPWRADYRPLPPASSPIPALGDADEAQAWLRLRDR